MLFHADAHFRMGSGHEAEGSPCQDYALADTAADGAPFAVVSDGCSTSGRTDVGARVLALASRRILRAPAEAAADAEAALGRFTAALRPAAAAAASLLGLESGDLDATLGAVQGLPDGGARAFLLGDGVIAARTAAGLAVTLVDWAGNMPGYPAYLLDAPRRQAFLAESEAAAAEEGRAPCRVRRLLLAPDGAVLDAADEARAAADGLRGVAEAWSAAAAPDVVAVMTDGALQIAGVAWEEAVAELTAVKNARQGAFITRRMTRALGAFARRGARPVDDIAVGALAAAGNE